MAKARGAEFYELELKGQYRCSGSEGYLEWLDCVFDMGGSNDIDWKEEYEFAIMDSPEELESRIIGKIENDGCTARIVAGFCWPWSKPNADGSLVTDIEIDGWERPWNRKEKGSEPADKHPYTIWATDAAGVAEVGCIYSAQGFEFDYCGVIFGNDLAWDDDAHSWAAIKTNSYDTVVKRSADLEVNLRNTYRVLLSRGMKGTFVFFADQGTRAFFEKMLDDA